MAPDLVLLVIVVILYWLWAGYSVCKGIARRQLLEPIDVGMAIIGGWLIWPIVLTGRFCGVIADYFNKQESNLDA